ncbi:ComEC family competence protein [Chitinophaga agrisoli]|uniref:ComEC family competence protein n=1 Tax=Chitinophaga agrisoli TaxID=2607653 RepID=A0A5B2W3F7_9BACT|nr:ComEC/Rec2 family competence protein [Chitinophaga agrisoli]KAA2245192.1 ComEC family competence protein [Chitinophaga agrisoli]
MSKNQFCNPLKATPFLRLVIPLAAGICLQIHCAVSWPYWVGVALLLLAGLYAWRLLPPARQYVLNGWRGMLLYLLLFCAGGLLVPLKDIRRQPGYFGNRLQSADTLLVTLQEPLQERARSDKTVAAVEAVLLNDRLIAVQGNLLLYLQRDTTNRVLQCGDRVWICGTRQPVSNSGNPGAFDYRRYCANRQVFHQAYIRAGHWKKASRQHGHFIAKWLLQARAWCLHTLQRYMGEGPESALAAALLIGYRYDLDRDMVQAYTNAGVVHIIAISGMHLALIYGSLIWLLQWLPPRRLANLLKAAIIISILWGFALVTGAAASILRAAVMFSVLAIGQFVLDRYTNMYNSLAASAFLLLCYDPWLLLDAGFQLSYLAVLSLLLCYRPLYDLWHIPNKWLNKLWAAVALTLAAQLFTLPVCLYYFHQFPNLFLPANLLIVALSTIILYGLILLLLLAPIPVAAHYTGIAARGMITAMNRMVSFIEGLPYAVTDNIYLPLYGAICAYVMMGALAAAWLAKWKGGCWLALCAALCWAVMDVGARLQIQQRRQVIIYNVPGYTAIDILKGHAVQFAGDTAVPRTPALRQRYLQPARLINRSREHDIECFTKKGAFISLGSKRLVVVDSSWHACRPVKKIQVDYILLSHRPKLAISQLKDMFTCKMIIFDASNPFWQIQRWKNDCSALTLRCFSVPDQGAYLINF